MISRKSLGSQSSKMIKKLLKRRVPKNSKVVLPRLLELNTRRRDTNLERVKSIAEMQPSQKPMTPIAKKGTLPTRQWTTTWIPRSAKRVVSSIRLPDRFIPKLWSIGTKIKGRAVAATLWITLSRWSRGVVAQLTWLTRPKIRRRTRMMIQVGSNIATPALWPKLEKASKEENSNSITTKIRNAKNTNHLSSPSESSPQTLIKLKMSCLMLRCDKITSLKLLILKMLLGAKVVLIVKPISNRRENSKWEA